MCPLGLCSSCEAQGFLQPPSNELCVSINLEATNGTFPFFEQPLTNLLCISIIAQQPSNQLCISTMVSAHVQFAVHEESWIQWLTPGQQSTENSMTWEDLCLLWAKVLCLKCSKKWLSMVCLQFSIRRPWEMQPKMIWHNGMPMVTCFRQWRL